MKKKITNIFAKASFFALLAFTSNSFAQAPTANTAGTLSPSHVAAVWIENGSGAFVKTKLKYGKTSNMNHLFTWTANSTSNVVDATTGATLTSYTAPLTFTWNGTDVNSSVVADGTYNVMVELGWGEPATTAHALATYSFVKGPAGVNLTPTGTTNFSNISLVWTPNTTGIAEKEIMPVRVFPNPAANTLNIDLSSVSNSCEIKIMNLLGAKVIEQKVTEIGGVKTLDISTFSNGTYIIDVVIDGKDNFTKFVVSK